MSDAVYYYYLDASVFVKLAVDEPGSLSIKDFFNKTPNACITQVSFIEAIGVLKRKWEGDWINPNYLQAVEHLVQWVYGGKPKIMMYHLQILHYIKMSERWR